MIMQMTCRSVQMEVFNLFTNWCFFFPDLRGVFGGVQAERRAGNLPVQTCFPQKVSMRVQSLNMLAQS